MKRFFRILPRLIGLLLLLCLGFREAVSAAETIHVSGTGISLGLATELGVQLSRTDPDLTVAVLPSMGSGGGLKALRDGVLDASFSARRLKPEEQALGQKEAGCLRTPLVFATKRLAPNGFGSADLPGLYSSVRPTWDDGADLKVILRSRSGSELPYLASKVPGLGDAFESAFSRPDISIGTSDQINAGLAISIQDSLAIMTLLQIRSENLPLTAVAIDGVTPLPETVADGSYPFSLRVCLILPKSPKAGALRLAEQMMSPDGRRTMIELGATPSE